MHFSDYFLITAQNMDYVTLGKLFNPSVFVSTYKTGIIIVPSLWQFFFFF